MSIGAAIVGAGASVLEAAASLEEMFRARFSLSRTRLPTTLERIWKKAYKTPLVDVPEYLPAFALG